VQAVKIPGNLSCISNLLYYGAPRPGVEMDGAASVYKYITDLNATYLLIKAISEDDQEKIGGAIKHNPSKALAHLSYIAHLTLYASPSQLPRYLIGHQYCIGVAVQALLTYWESQPPQIDLYRESLQNFLDILQSDPEKTCQLFFSYPDKGREDLERFKKMLEMGNKPEKGPVAISSQTTVSGMYSTTTSTRVISTTTTTTQTTTINTAVTNTATSVSAYPGRWMTTFPATTTTTSTTAVTTTTTINNTPSESGVNLGFSS
jgi:hypothetical protein